MSTAPTTTSEPNPQPAPKEQIAATISTQVWDTIRALQRPGQPDLLEKILGLFVKNSQDLVGQLRGALQQNDAQTVFRAAHTLKSSSANVGAVGLAEWCKELEALGRQNQIGDAADLFKQIEAEHGAVLKVLNAELQRTQGV